MQIQHSAHAPIIGHWTVRPVVPPFGRMRWDCWNTLVVIHLNCTGRTWTLLEATPGNYAAMAGLCAVADNGSRASLPLCGPSQPANRGDREPPIRCVCIRFWSQPLVCFSLALSEIDAAANKSYFRAREWSRSGLTSASCERLTLARCSSEICAAVIHHWCVQCPVTSVGS